MIPIEGKIGIESSECKKSFIIFRRPRMNSILSRLSGGQKNKKPTIKTVEKLPGRERKVKPTTTESTTTTTTTTKSTTTTTTTTESIEPDPTTLEPSEKRIDK